jgi:WD40 repeat protein
VAADTQEPVSLFISYAREDLTFVRALRSELPSVGAEPWFDLEDILPTADWWDAIQKAISKVTALVFVLSPYSLGATDGWCLRELTHARDCGKRIITVRIADVSGHQLPAPLDSQNWITVDDHEDLQPVAKQVVHAATIDLAWVTLHGSLLQKAQEWLREDRRGDLLLSARSLRSVKREIGVDHGYRSPTMIPLQRDYLSTSRRRVQHRRRVFGSVAAVLALVIGGLVLASLLLGHTATREHEAGTSRGLAAASGAQLPSDPELSLLLAVKAIEVDRTDAAADALRAAVAAYHPKLTAHVHSQGNIVGFAANALTAVTVAPSGRWVATGGTDGTVRVWQARHFGRVRVVLRAPSTAVRDVAFSSDGRRVASANEDGTARIWTWQTPTSQPIVLKTERGIANSVAFPPHALFGQRLATGGEDGLVRIWDWTTKRVVRILRGPGSRRSMVNSVGFSWGGDAVVGGYEDGSIRIWQLQSGRPPVTLRAGHSPVTDASFASDPTFVISASDDGSVRTWHWERRRLLRVLHPHIGRVNSVAMTSDLARIAAGGDNHRVALYFEGSGRPDLLVGHQQAVRSVAFGPSDDSLASSGDDGVLNLWRLPPVPRSMLFDTSEEVYGLALSPDGRQVASAGVAGVVRLWPLRHDGKPIALRATSRRVPSNLTQVAYSPDGRSIAAVDRQGAVRIWRDVAQAEKPILLRASKEELYGVAFSPDGTRVAAVGRGGTVRVWRWQQGGAPTEFKSAEAATGVAFSPDGTQIATAGFDGAVRLWSVKDPRKPVVLTAPDHAPLNSVAYSPDGARVVTGSLGGALRVWTLSTRSPAQVRRGPGAQWGATFSSDGQRVLSVNDNGTISVWSWSRNDTPLLLSNFVQGRILAAQFNPKTGQVISANTRGYGQVRSCVVCRQIGEVLAVARGELTRRLTRAERARYHVPD